MSDTQKIDGAAAIARILSMSSEKDFLANELAALSAQCERLKVRIKSIDDQIEAERNYIKSYNM